MKQLIILILAFLSVNAGTNYTGVNDTFTFVNFKADSVKYGRAFDFGNCENRVLLCYANDTNQAGFAADSINLKYGVQRGYAVVNSSGKLDTTWRAIEWYGALSTAATDTAGKWISKATAGWSDTTTGISTFSWRMMDSTSVTGFIVGCVPIVSDYAVFARYVIGGITKNRIGGWIKVRMNMNCRAASIVHGM